MPLQQAAWNYWDSRPIQDNVIGEIPVVDVQQHREDLLDFLEASYGKDWRKRPLLLRRLWDPSSELNSTSSTSRKLSKEGLLKETMVIPYFSDATKDLLAPDAEAPIRDIVSNITFNNSPHKIATQHFIQRYPQLIQEVAPIKIVTELFGNFFEADNLIGSGPFRIFPPLTTVPLFVAWKKNQGPGSPSSDAHSTEPYTRLHCEPIGNIAVQLSGKKRWTLVLNNFWTWLRPSISPDSRAFLASFLPVKSLKAIPQYTVTTETGDALWVPTWTWHRVDYVASGEISIAASLFHFRPIDFVTNNPLFATIILPALILEVIGYNTQ